ncbi:hypothetical protein [Cellulosimicrobium cellulans]|uniref:hypothetical protein n=1 Tax=Cellulosimicrobium cellulans TaxID=1710 RepID=UPI0009F2E8CA|nr:hypothetical protein [Cellulosimicrobium cellulans]
MLVVAATLVGCGTGAGAERDCEQMWESLSESVDGVTAADFECRRSFGDSGQKGKVTVAATTQDEAVAMMEATLRAYAASPDVDDASVLNLVVATEDDSVTVGPGLLGFNGAPAMYEVREHYGIQP